MHWLRLMLGLGILAIIIVGGLYFVFTQQYESTIERPVLNLDGAAFPTEEGTNIALDDIKARIRIINFWASWSPSSVDELKALTLIQEGYGGVVKVIAINRDATRDDGISFLSKHGLEGSLLYLYDSSDSYYKELGGYNMPETVFINSKDEVLTHIHGPMNYEDMQSALRAFLAE